MRLSGPCSPVMWTWLSIRPGRTKAVLEVDHASRRWRGDVAGGDADDASAAHEDRLLGQHAAAGGIGQQPAGVDQRVGSVAAGCCGAGAASAVTPAQAAAMAMALKRSVRPLM